jgi:hypothetical protein
MTVDSAQATPVPARSRGPTGRLRLPAVALLVGAVPFALHAWAALHGYFWQDDFVITYRASQASPFDLGYLFQAYNGEHLAPGMFLLAWLVTAIAPLSYPVAVLPLLAMLAAAMVLFWRLLVRCFGERWAIVPAFAVFAWSPLILVPTLWWAYGAQLIPLLLTMIGALHAHVRYLRDGSRRHAVHALLWTAAGLAFYEKAALIPALLLAVTLLLASDGSMFATVRRHAWLWLAHAGLLVGYAALYLTHTSTKVGSGQAEHTGFAELVRRLLVDTFLPGVFGGPLSGAGSGVSWIAPAPLIRVLAVVLAVALVVGGLVLGGRQAGLAWLLLAGYVAVDLALVALTRLRLVGTVVGADPRYIADAVPVAVLFATFSLLAPRTRRTPRAAGPLVTVLTIAFAVSATASYLRLAPAAQARHAREYVANAAAALSRDPGIVLYDGGVPGDIMINWFGLDARQSVVLGLLPGPPRFDRPGETLYALDGNGQPHRIERLDNPVAAAAGPVPDCGYAVTQETTTIPLTAVVGGKRIVRLAYYTADGGPGLVAAGDTFIRVDFERGLHVLYVPVSGYFGGILVSRATPVGAVCVAEALVGEPTI